MVLWLVVVWISRTLPTASIEYYRFKPEYGPDTARGRATLAVVCFRGDARETGGYLAAVWPSAQR
jgi:hypothetical protein